jgi:predicted DNA binding CopG/RHH family protein
MRDDLARMVTSYEAKWWDGHKDMVERNLIQAMRDGTAVRGVAQRLTREARGSRNVTIRMAEADLDLARKQAEAKGLPRQIYIKSVPHEALVKTPAPGRRVRGNAVHLMMFRWGRRSFYVVCQRSPRTADHKVRWSAPPK